MKTLFLLISAWRAFACISNSQISIHENADSWSVEVVDDQEGTSVWNDTDGNLTIMALSQAMDREPDNIQGYKATLQKALMRSIGELEKIQKTPKIPPELKKEFGTLAKTQKELLNQIKSGPLQKKHLDFIYKKIIPLYQADVKDGKSHIAYEVEKNGEKSSSALQNFPAYDTFVGNSKGERTRGGCSYGVRFYAAPDGSKPASDEKKSGTTTRRD